MKKKEVTTATLPRNYKELYFDSIKQNWRKLIGYGLMIFLFAIPVIALLIFKDFYTLSLATSSLADEEKEAYKIVSEIFFSLGVSALLLILSIGISGASRVLLLFSREEPIFFFSDFAKGVKQNLKNNFIFFLGYSLLLFICYFIIAIFKASFASYIPLGILQGLFFPILLVNIETTAIYSWNIKDSFTNAAIIYIKNFFIIILFAILLSTPLFVLTITNILVKYVLLFLLIVIIYPLVALGMRVYMNYVLDRDINSVHYPEIYKKGIYVPEVSKTISYTFTNDSTYKELIEDQYIGKYAYHLLDYIQDIAAVENDKIIPFKIDAWPKEDVINSLNKLKQLTMKYLTKEIVRSDYSAILCMQEKRSKVAIVMAGGGYGEVCTLPEDLPVSMELYNKGFSVVSFSYSVKEEAKKAISQLKDLIYYLDKNAGLFNIDMADYIVVGFSAGAHLCGELATDNFGYEKSGLNKPGLLVLGYPVIDLSLCEGTRTNLLGQNANKETIEEHSINKHIYANSPSIYFWQNKEDNVVPYQNSLLLLDALEKNKIKFKFESFDSDVHGWGIASNTLAEGWIDRMCEFYLSLINK